MTDTYKATPECWEWQEKWASKEVPDEDSSCFLELRARVEALEAQASSREVAEPAPVAGRDGGERRYGVWTGCPMGQAEDLTCCIEEVWPSRACGLIPHQCSRKRGYSPDGLYCKQHAKKHDMEAQ